MSNDGLEDFSFPEDQHRSGGNIRGEMVALKECISEIPRSRQIQARQGGKDRECV